jgi:hypothetical protein
VISIDTLPDEVLVIFDFCCEYQDIEDIEKWQLLVHVCQRWRSVVFGSPRRLNLRLAFIPKTPVNDRLGVWPELPLVVLNSRTIELPEDLDNISALLGHSHRVCQIILHVPSSRLEEVSTAMQVPFPELTELRLNCDERVRVSPTLRDSFLGGSAPRMRTLRLTGISFPGLPKLLLSATHLVELHLGDLPLSEYNNSPEALIVALSTLTNLGLLSIRFKYPQYYPGRAHQHSPPPTRSVLPVLTALRFDGFTEYLEDFVAHIDTPLLNSVHVTPFNRNIFDTKQFNQFIGRSPKFKAFKKARLCFGDDALRVDLSRTSGDGVLEVTVLCWWLERQLLTLEKVCISSLLPFSMSEDLYISEDASWGPESPSWPVHFEITLWLGLLCQFIAVKNLYLFKNVAPRIMPALHRQDLGEWPEMLPSLQNILLELEPSSAIQEVIEEYVAARQNPITVSRWDRGTFC